MNILNFGSLNLDFVYAVDHIVMPGETILSEQVQTFCGGKGLNQSIALARAGGKVFHAGMVGPDGGMLVDALWDNGIDAALVRQMEERTGNAIIQVAADGQNSIVLYGGANRHNDSTYIDHVLSHFGPGDMVLLQNEINLVGQIIDKAWEKNMRIVLNPSPFDARLDECDMGKVSLFLLNEVEGEQLTGCMDADSILGTLTSRWHDSAFVLTLGSRGVAYADSGQRIHRPACQVPVVDTTAAGDTFTGYFLTALQEGRAVDKALDLAIAAASITVSRPGASVSIPYRHEVDGVTSHC